MKPKYTLLHKIQLEQNLLVLELDFTIYFLGFCVVFIHLYMYVYIHNPRFILQGGTTRPAKNIFYILYILYIFYS